MPFAFRALFVVFSHMIASMIQDVFFLRVFQLGVHGNRCFVVVSNIFKRPYAKMADILALFCQHSN